MRFGEEPGAEGGARSHSGEEPGAEGGSSDLTRTFALIRQKKGVAYDCWLHLDGPWVSVRGHTCKLLLTGVTFPAPFSPDVLYSEEGDRDDQQKAGDRGEGAGRAAPAQRQGRGGEQPAQEAGRR